MSLYQLVLFAVTSIALACMRLAGHTGAAYQAIAHMVVGGFFLCAWYCWQESRTYSIGRDTINHVSPNRTLSKLYREDAIAFIVLAVALTLVEIYAALPKILALINR